MSVFGLIYKITNNINDKSYIGQTTYSLSSRAKTHMYMANKGSNTAIHKALRKYGEDIFTYEVLEYNNSKEELNLAEEWYIRYYKTFVGFKNCKGYNLTLGGGGTVGWVPTSEYRKQQSKNNSGKGNPMYGRSFMTFMSDKERNLYRKRMSIKNLGDGNPNYGKRGSKSKLAKKYIIITPEGEEIIIHGLRDFCRRYKKDKLNHNYLSYCVSGKINSYKGYRCRYY